MLFHRISTVVAAVAVTAGSFSVAQAETPVDTALTYQGRLSQSGQAVNASADFRFRIFDADVDGNQLGDTFPIDNVPVVDGAFTVQLDADAGIFNGSRRWLQISVRSPHDPGNVGAFTTLTPRQPLTAAPYASHAIESQFAANAMLAEQVDGMYVDSSDTLVIGAQGERSGDLYLERHRPEITLNSNSDELGAGGVINFKHHDQPQGALISWDAEYDLMTIKSGSAYLRLFDSGRMNLGLGFEADATFHVQSGEQVALGADGGFFQLGYSEEDNMVFDSNDIMARYGTGARDLYLNREGGDVLMGAFSNGDTHVGINTSLPGSFTLAVDGSAAKPGGGSWSSFSDARLKHDIEPLAKGTLDQVLSLHGYTFEYDNEAIEKRLALPGRQIGLIAQEVEQVFPDWVEEDAEGYKFVTERGTTALFVEAIRELRSEKDAQIASLRQINADQQRQIDELRQLILHSANQSSQQ